MNFDALRFTIDHGIASADSDDKHWREGWLNIDCPFCTGNPGFHLGFNTDGDFWNCWRCGWHNNVEVIREVLGLNWDAAKKLALSYGARPQHKSDTPAEDGRPRIATPPPGIGPMQKQHKDYLHKRGFNAEALEEEWQLLGTGPIGAYKFRIIAPIIYRGRMVSYQGRDITDRSTLKYKACAKPNEAIDHKHVLYGIDKAVGHSVVVVEGITDVWRLGPGAVATFGVQWHWRQLSLLTHFARAFIMYDFGEDESYRQAKALAFNLAGLGVTVELLLGHNGDPADLNDVEARELMRHIKGF